MLFVSSRAFKDFSDQDEPYMLLDMHFGCMRAAPAVAQQESNETPVRAQLPSPAPIPRVPRMGPEQQGTCILQTITAC